MSWKIHEPDGTTHGTGLGWDFFNSDGTMVGEGGGTFDCSPLSTGGASPELIFANGDVIMVCVPA